MKTTRLAVAGMAVLLLGCMGETVSNVPGATPKTPVETSLAALIAVDGCGPVLDYFKKKTVDEMALALEANRAQALDMGQYGCMLYAAGAEEDGAAPPEDNGVEEGDFDDSAKEYSETNTQVKGVDEADFVKNDGSAIYILADGAFQILDAWPPEEAKRTAIVAIEGEPKKMFVFADRAVVFSSLEPLQVNLGYYDPWGGYYGGYGGGECTYGYDCEFTGDGNAMKMTVLDIEDRNAPEVVRETVFNGSYLNARRINNNVYVMAVFPKSAVPGLVFWPEELGNVYDWCWNEGDFPYTAEQINAMFDALIAENIQKIEDANIADFLPSIKDTRYIDGDPVADEGLLAECSNFYMSQTEAGTNLLSAVSFDMTDLGQLAATTVVGRPGALYANADSIYLASREYADQSAVWFYEDSTANPEASTIHKFKLSGTEIGTTYVGSGVVKGHVLNQFSMDEQEGYLRIATTTGWVPDPNVHSTVSVLAEADGKLAVVGMLDNIAPHEDIRSARFDGEYGFIVTFKKTDPLFVIDLSNPTTPLIKGELKIPGFSTYLHLMDDTHLLSIGYDADDQGDFAWFAGIQLQVFDVTDPANPFLEHKELIGTRGTNSEAALNHLAFNYFKPKQMLAIPMVVCEGGSGGNFGDLMTFSGLMVYKVTAEDGFEYQGGLPLAQPETEDNYWGACNMWWSSGGDGAVKRSIFMDDYVWAVAEDRVLAATLDKLDLPVADISLSVADK